MMAQVVGDQPAQQGVGVLGVAEVPGAVELVQAREDKAGGVADVVQPGGGFQQVGVRAEDRYQAACPGGDAPGRAPSGGAGVRGGVSGRAVRPMVPTWSCGPG